MPAQNGMLWAWKAPSYLLFSSGCPFVPLLWLDADGPCHCYPKGGHDNYCSLDSWFKGGILNVTPNLKWMLRQEKNPLASFT